MYPVLILRSELVCLVILVFLYFTSRSYNVDRESRSFLRILYFSIVHVIFDIVTVITVNNTGTVPPWLNWLCHIIFYLSAILFSNEIVNYVVAIVYPRKARKLYALGHFLTLIYICCLSFLRIEYVEDVGTYSSAGPAAIVGYGLAFVFFISALVIIFTHMNMMSSSIKNALIPMMLVLMITEISQIIWRSVLFTGGAITIVTVGFFFSLENPVTVFKKKAMTDALTGVKSRSSFEEDIEKFDKRFREKPGDDYIFVFCDLNDLHNINNRFGHAEGDSYITLISSAINQSMRHCSAVYRIGGDEFLILYYQISESTVEKEINELQRLCTEKSGELNYNASVSVGYARSSKSYKSLRDVVKTADYSMYQYKSRMKSGDDHANVSLGTKLNYSGLTDKMFDAMCASNDRSYPFITNLETNVTRIAPGWKKYFGLENEFFADFFTVWEQRIHPDYRADFSEEIAAVVNGHRKYHNYEYLVKKSDGDYVRVTCHGSVYRNDSDGSSYFTGYMINHGTDDNTDSVTGLKNFEELIGITSRYMDEGRCFSIMKLKLINFARVNMLYGYAGGNEVVKKIAEILCRELGKGGQVFCQGAVNFTILFDTCDEQTLESFYKNFFRMCASGLETDIGMVPVQICGGAITNRGSRWEIERIRSSLVLATEESHYYSRNRLVLYRQLDDAYKGTDISLLAKIHADALDKMEYFQLRYQPIAETSSRKTVGAEALLRWIHPVYGEVFPDKFINFLENDPCYYRLGLRIIDEAVKEAKKHQEKIPGFRINVNITALQLQNDSFADDVTAILKKYDFAPGGLVLELTERCKEMDGSFLAERIAELRSRGILIAFDDLGTGYSTISLLMDIPVDEIKLDKDFVRDLGKRESYQVFVRALVLGRTSAAYNYNICFEGIENEEMLAMVSGYGNFLAQGYYFSKPMLKEAFADYISSECFQIYKK